MDTKKKLFKIFGPVILAGILLTLFLVSPFNVRKVNQHTLQVAALSQSKNIFKGNAVKQKAFEENYVPFFGSSELSRMDAFHPASLAERYDRNYRPFLLGGPGSTSLAQFYGMQGSLAQLKGKKAVMIISPQWFVKQGTNPAAFSLYYSNLETVSWLKHVNDGKMDRFAAERLLAMPTIQNDHILKKAVLQVKDGQKLSSSMQTYIDLKYNQLKHEDQLFSTLALKDNTEKIAKVAAKLPATYDQAKLDALAYQMGAKKTNNNPFDIDDRFFDKNLRDKYFKLKNKQSSYNYVSSPEYSDFELVLNQFAENNMNVMFVIPPVNEKWSNYTGLSREMLQACTEKIKYQLRSQGFTNIVDLSKDGGERYFMQDTIHLGWRGWLKMDQAVGPFLSTDQKTPTYKINDYFYTKEWQKLEGQALNEKVK
ncbi:D-alanyl-lipoteichoic acid biosynthesis protein DltD [Ligilactobacillus faecis]|uniref:Protein DltD n=1 Tax=Ligilactobacillus faecis TaxID=762833 RepID=A0ABV4DMX1_9LACO